jgi:hypothetical protein
VDRREVQHVESHLPNVGEFFDHIVEGAVPLWIVRHGSWKDLVPGGETRPHPIYLQREHSLVLGEVGASRVALHQLQKLLAEGRGDPGVHVALSGDAAQLGPKQLPIVTRRALHRGFHDGGALEQLALHILARLRLLPQLRPPASEIVRPRRNGVLVAGVAVELDAAGPAVVFEEVHALLQPLRFPFHSVADGGGDGVVTFLEDVRLDLQRVAHLAFHGVPATVELRGDRFDHNVLRRAGERRSGSSCGRGALAELSRRAALRSVGQLDCPSEEQLDRIVSLAAAAIRAPIAMITMVDADRQVCRSATGLPAAWPVVSEAPGAYSFCRQTVAYGETLAITDARRHPMVRSHPATARGVVAYLGTPIVVDGQHALGTLCVMEQSPREWTAADRHLLEELARTARSGSVRRSSSRPSAWAS